ncbi:glycolate oxidase subunit GlcE [Thiohalobacter thiocyanaticus]|uniref:Glycolate oxidase subunit GlcE n=1 Tax=Thiohalobacter thiocyanaticus TaxID=585455 RepID=A0A426QFW9_9GAMM|nr:glycolate oxidase subunit GlcE [Thiohalobacter thiocyanaticus]
MCDMTAELSERVRAAADSGSALRIHGGNTKAFLGLAVRGEALSVHDHDGVLHYEPSELVITARAGTPLSEIERLLAAEGQMLAFEPPHFGPTATLGGTLAAGLSGPRRPYAGAARDFMLGCRLLNGRGEDLHFGGEVMKNVAGYDLSRLQIGAFGTLGVILEASLKVLPRPEVEQTLVQERGDREAIELMNTWAGKPLPLSGACYDGDHLYVRLSGAETAVKAAANKLGGEPHARAESFWQRLREQELSFFKHKAPLWRCAVAPASPPLALDDAQLVDWGGGLRWLASRQPAERIRRLAAGAGGHATLYRNGDEDTPRFHPLDPALLALHQRLKQALDPQGILNPGRMYPEF